MNQNRCYKKRWMRCYKREQCDVRKPGACKYPIRICQKPALDGYEFCQKHILEDKNAPFRVCGYVYPINGKKCVQPAPKGDRKESGFCALHTKKSQSLRQKAASRHCPPQTTENLLSSLTHYAPDSPLGQSEEETEKNGSHIKNPFVDIDANQVNTFTGLRVLDYNSESDSDVEPSTLENVWKDADRDSSDAESIDSQEEDPLKRAGNYSLEEAVGLMRDKFSRLQFLYTNQLKRLHRILKEKKRKYLHNLAKEKESLASIHSQSKTSPKELKLYEKLKALNRFHKHSGLEAVMHQKIKEKRNQAKKMKKFRKSRLLDSAGEGSVISAHACKCTFSIGGVKCGLKTLPSSKFCRKHILQDPHQVLFRPCGCEKAEVVCQEPTLDVFENTSCMLHVSLPVLPYLNIEPEKSLPNDVTEIKTELKVEPEIIPTPTAVKTSPDDEETLQQIIDVKNEELVVGKDKPSSTNEVVLDDIMANVDVVEEVIMSQAEVEQSANDNITIPTSTTPQSNDLEIK